MKLKKQFLFFAALLLTGSLLLWQNGLSKNEAEAKAESDAIPYNELRLLSDIYARVKADYVEEVDGNKLIIDAIHGMLNGLDPYSNYLPPRNYKNLKISTTGKFGGLGIEVVRRDGLIKIVSPIENTPAERAGIRAGDYIIKINDESVQDLQLDEAIDRMRGEVGTDVTVTIAREGQEPFDLTITRAVIKIASVKNALIKEDQIGYIRIAQFQSKTAQSVREKVANLIDDNGGKIKGFILDLRNNPGGVLDAAVGVSDVFLEANKMIVYTQGRRKDAYSEFRTKSSDITEGAPLVILINQGTASASEIVSGAMQDHKRAKLIGKKSFGKGSVQTLQQLNYKGSALKLTTAKYYTPSGRSIHDAGIEPDVEVEWVAPEEELPDDVRLTIKNDFPKIIERDVQIQRAVQELQAMILAHNDAGGEQP